MTHQQKAHNDYIDFIIGRLEIIKKDYSDKCEEINAECEEYQCDEYDCSLARNEEALDCAIRELKMLKVEED